MVNRLEVPDRPTFNYQSWTQYGKSYHVTFDFMRHTISLRSPADTSHTHSHHLFQDFGASVNPSSTNPLPPELDVAVSAQLAVKSIVSLVQNLITNGMFLPSL